MRKRLKEAGLTQREFSKRLGVEESFTSMVISGERQFSYERSINAAEILGCHPKALHEWREVPLSELQKGKE
ncbi:helix-turn-helix domain-containing protein [Ferviditalea candida]|uniref:Helix-turn-helix transcriptional regulator n=1 Tax=Ferviditalea candida TaxID=3108399 RepID=A0ABU5ZLH0_9BACL|nr:helix-turn-helix transcriptional regulator [Paenibacillaceae bacterium T2]